MTVVIWAVWGVSLATMALFGQTAALRWLIVLLPFCVAASAVATFIASRCVSFSVVIKETATKHQGARGELTVKNRSFLPIVQLRCTMLIKNLLTGEQYEQPAVFSVLPKDNRKLAVAIESRRCGHLRIAFKKSVAVDYFGLFRFPIKFFAKCDTLVMPDTFEVRVIPSAECFCPEDSDEYEPDRAGNDVSEVHQIRAYIPGDSVRQIHWKLTSKFDELMVKQSGQPLKYSMVLFLDLSAPRKTLPTPACLDALAEAAVSLSQGLLDAGIAHMIVWRQIDGTLGKKAVKDIGTLTEALPDMLAGQEKEISAEEQRRADLFDKISFSQLVWLCADEPKVYFETNAKITAVCCTKKGSHHGGDIDDAIWITPKTFKKDLANIII